MRSRWRHLQATPRAGGAIDPAQKATPYWPATPPGVWVATTPTSISPEFLTLRPRFLTSTAQFRPGPPVALDSVRWTTDVDEVRRMGGKISSERSSADTVQAQLWALYNTEPALRAIATQPERSLFRNAHLYALVEMTVVDATLATADGKLHYGFWRPIQAIRTGGGNPAIAADPTWEPLLTTPLHPEYPCGHCLRAAAAAMEAEGSPPQGGACRSPTTRCPAWSLPWPPRRTMPGKCSSRGVAPVRMSARPHRRARHWGARSPPTPSPVSLRR